MQVSTQFPLWRFLSVTLWNHRQASDIIKHSSFGLHVGTKSQSRAEALRRTADKRGHFLTFSWYVTFSKYLRSPPVLNRQNRTKLKNYSLILNILRQKNKTLFDLEWVWVYFQIAAQSLFASCLGDSPMHTPKHRHAWTVLLLMMHWETRRWRGAKSSLGCVKGADPL